MRLCQKVTFVTLLIIVIDIMFGSSSEVCNLVPPGEMRVLLS